MKYERASDEELRENGYDPKCIDSSDDIDDPEREGPYAVYRDAEALCPCCSGQTEGWTVVNLMTATGVGQDWFGDNGMCEAEEHADALNHAWLAGYESRAPGSFW